MKMFCKTCGSPVEDGDLFCPKCGNKIEKITSSARKSSSVNTTDTGENPAPEAFAGRAPAPSDETFNWSPGNADAVNSAAGSTAAQPEGNFNWSTGNTQPKPEAGENSGSASPENSTAPETGSSSVFQQAPASQAASYGVPAGPAGFSALPPKKKHKGVKIAGIAVLCAVVLIGTAGFFTKAYFARDFAELVYGKDNYAKTTAKAAVTAMGDSTVSTCDALSALLVQNNSDVAYSTTNQLKVTFDSKTAGEIDASAGSGFSQQLADYLSTLTFQQDYNRNAGLSEETDTISDADGKLISADGITDKDGTTYYQCPELSDVYLYAKGISLFPQGLRAGEFSYDSAQFSSSVSKLTNICENALDGAQVTSLDDQTLTVGTQSTTAQKVTLSLSSDQVQTLMQNLLEDMKNDSYLYTFFSENYKSIEGSAGWTALFSGSSSDSENFTQADYTSAIQQMEDDLKDSDTPALSVSLYVQRDGSVTGYSCEFNGDVDSSLNFLQSGTGAESAKALSACENGKEIFNTVMTPTSAADGTVSLNFIDPDTGKQAGLKVDYTGKASGSFLGKTVMTGSYTISITDPDDWIADSLLNGYVGTEYENSFQDLLNSTVQVTTSLDNGTLNSVFHADIGGIGTFDVTSATVKTDSSAITVPSVNDQNGIDLSTDSTSDLASQYGIDALKYLSTAIQSHSSLSALLGKAGLTSDMIDSYVQYYEYAQTYGTSDSYYDDYGTGTDDYSDYSTVYGNM